MLFSNLKRNLLAFLQSLHYAFQHFQWLQDPHLTPHEREQLQRYSEQIEI